MAHERSPSHRPQRPYEVFGFTKLEQLYWRVSNKRFEEIIQDKGTHIHTIKESSNSFGEFLFVTTSRFSAQDRICMTFFGLGFHEYRERWLTTEWFWYQTSPHTELLRQQIPVEEAQRIIQEHHQSILPHIRPDTQTERGKFFETLADLTDDDGALAEMEDWGDLFDL